MAFDGGRQRLRGAWPLLAFSLVGCGAAGEGPPLDGRLHELVAAQSWAVGRAAGSPLRFATPPRQETVSAGGERRPAVVVAGERWWWRGVVPDRATLVAAALPLPQGGDEASAVEITVTAHLPLRRILLERVYARADATSWLPLTADLGALAGRDVELEVAVAGIDGAAPAIAWAPFHVTSRGPHPNLVLIVVDTLRADRLTTYGAERATSPAIERLLAGRGVVVERAYSPAPWTLPSVRGLLAGQGADGVRDGEPDPYRLPPEPTLAEALRARGYQTGAFVANPLLTPELGFARGFDTYFVPLEIEAIGTLKAAELVERSLRWLRSVAGGPSFLYLHLVDPHDPYENEDMPGGRSVFSGEYRGALAGDHVQGLHAGRIELADPEQDVPYLRSLYDGEVRYVDRWLGEMLRAMPRRAADTLFLLTADHGEELHEHGGWKHGRTLYEEQLWVPFVARWDGELPAGARRQGPVSLLDVAPTLLAAAGGEPPAAWQGRDLLPWLRGGAELPRRPVLAEHHGFGPTRASASAGGWKLIVYDLRQRYTPGNPLQDALHRDEQRRLERVELYHLTADPGERHNLAGERPQQVRRLSPLLHQRLATELPGLRVLLAGAADGRPVRARLRFARQPEGWESYFLAPEDAVELAGRELSLELYGEGLEKGVRVIGDVGAVEVLALEPAGLEVRHPGGGRVDSAVPVGRLRAAGWPGRATAGGALLLWEPVGTPAQPAAADGVDPETRRRLEALGYGG
ncbi:MAG TPA: sulfatase [Thermoanaerobaculia bacterium]|nr:sulfatase [Thermoanaerobaculia bacterium]